MKKVKGGIDLSQEFKAVDSHNGYLFDMLKKFKFDNLQDRILLAIDKAYEDGFNDGVNEVQEQQDRENKRQGRNDI